MSLQMVAACNTRGRRVAGFTLIEVLVVVLIAGVLIGIAFVVPPLGGRQALGDEAVRLRALIGQARERAWMDDREMGLSLVHEGYRWWRWSRETGEWGILSEVNFRDYRLPQGITLHDGPTRTDSGPLVQPEYGKVPTLVFLSDLQMTPFSVELSLTGDKHEVVLLESDGIGPVTTP